MDEAYQKNMNKVYVLIETKPIKAVCAWAIDRIGRDRKMVPDFRETLVKKGV